MKRLLFVCLSSVLILSFPGAAVVSFSCAQGPELEPQSSVARSNRDSYDWTSDHMQVGVRWQPFPGRPLNNAFDAQRPVIAQDSSYVQFWVSWNGAEPQQANTDYANGMSRHLATIDTAVNECVARGIKVEFVFFHCPEWASESGNVGGWKPKPDLYRRYVERIARHFKDRVDAYQLAHESNLKGFMKDGDVDYLMSEIYIKGAETIRAVYMEAPARNVIISTSGCSPCQPCQVLTGLKGQGGEAVNDFYDRQIANRELMKRIDALNLNVTDHGDGFGNMDGSFVSSTWSNYDLVRSKLDAAGYYDKSIRAAESWITWDNGRNATDINGDGVKDEKDAFQKAITILGQCLERGLNNVNLPWSDNSSAWAMGLTKRRDYNGRIRQLNPGIVESSNDGGPDIVTRKIGLRGSDDGFEIVDGSGDIFTVKNYINPPDPNHLHYYIWKWYAQISGGSDEVIRHALAGELGNDITVMGPGFTGTERYRLASFNRTKRSFTVLIYSSGSNGKTGAKVSIPAQIQDGRHYNNKFSKRDFRGEGFQDGEAYRVRIVTNDISVNDGSDLNVREMEIENLVVSDNVLSVEIPQMRSFTRVDFIRSNTDSDGLNDKKED